MIRTSFVSALLVVGLAACTDEHDAGQLESSLTGTLTGSRAGWGTGDINLTTGGSADWSRWGRAGATSFDHKAGVTQQISNFTQLGTTAPIWLDYVSTFSWSDGTPTASASANLGGIYIDSPNVSGDGFRITVPADTTIKTLKLYLGNWNVRMKVQATLSDGAVGPYVDTTWDVPTATYSEQVYTIAFAAGSAGQALTVDATIDLNHATSGDLGEVWLQAATLTGAAAPPDTTPPTAPTNLTATASGTQINLAWTAATDNVGVTGYRVERCQGANCTSFAQIATPTTTSFGDPGLTPSTTYRYQVRASDAAGNLGPYSAIANATTGTGTSGSYSTTFSLTENPISEGGRWVNGQTTGINWRDVRTTTGFAFGTQPGTGAPPYDDSIAVLTGTWSPDHTAQATVRIVHASSSGQREVELHLRSTITASSSAGYEVLCNVNTNAGYGIQIVRWNGAVNDFSYIDNTPALHCVNGDVLKASIAGNPPTIKVWLNGHLKLNSVDPYPSPPTTGNPGIGFWNEGATNSDYGFSAFSASNGP